MIDYEKRVKALTCGNDGKLPCHNNECPYWVDKWHGIGLCNVIKKDADAADAIEALQAEVAFYKKRVCELCGTCPDDMSDPNNCEIAGHGMWVGVNPLVDSVQCSVCGGQLFSAELEPPYCPYCGAKMEVQDGQE